MKKRITLITVAALLLIVAFLLSMTNLHSPEEVLAPPTPNGEYRQLQQAFESAVGNGSSYQLQYPNEGDYRSAYVLYDLDGDGKEEAMVFYKKISDESSVRVNLLAQRDDQWVSLLDEGGYGNKIDSVTFSDLNNDGSSEVLFSWSLTGADSSRTLTVHETKLQGTKPSFRTLSNMPYRAMTVADMDSDGQPEILVLWNETTQKVQQNRAALMKMTGDKLQQAGNDVQLDSTASVYDDIQLQTEGRPMAFVDAMRGDNTMFTELLFWDNSAKSLRAPFTENETHTNRKTLRFPAIPSSDIDEDGRIEIPVSYGMPEDRTAPSRQNADKESDEPIYLTAWSVVDSADPGFLETQEYSLVNAANRFLLRIPNGYRNSLLAYQNSKTGVITVYGMTDDERGEPLFSLVYSADGIPDDMNEYTFLAQKDRRTVYGTLTSAGRGEGFTNEAIQNNLVFF